MSTEQVTVAAPPLCGWLWWPGLTGLAGGVLLVRGALGGDIPPLVLLVGHVTLAAFWLLALPLCAGRDRRLPWFGALAQLCLGPLGAAGLLLAAMFYAVMRRRATPFEEWYRSVLPDQISPPEEQLMERLRAWSEETRLGHHEPVPFVDILSTGSRADKQAAIALMARHYDPQFAPALRAALNDSDNAVRVQTASAITRVEEQFLARALVLERELERRPDDVGALWAVAQHYDAHASGGLSDPDAVVSQRRRAEQAYRRLMALEPGNGRAYWALGRLLVRAGRMREAARVFEQALSLPDAADHAGWRIWYCECLYCLKRYAELRREVSGRMSGLTEPGAVAPALADAVRLWGDMSGARGAVS